MDYKIYRNIKIKKNIFAISNQHLYKNKTKSPITSVSRENNKDPSEGPVHDMNSWRPAIVHWSLL